MISNETTGEKWSARYRKTDRQIPYFTLLLFGVVVRLFAAGISNELEIQDDVVFFDQAARDISARISMGIESPFLGWPWVDFIGFVYHYIHPDMSLIVGFHIVIGVSTGAILAKVFGRIYDDPKVERLVLIVLMFAPPVVIMSATGLKEQSIAFALAVIVWGVVRTDLTGTLAVLSGILMAYLLRNGVAIPLIGVLGVIYTFRVATAFEVSRDLKIALAVTLGAVLAIAAAWLSGTAIFAASKFGQFILLSNEAFRTDEVSRGLSGFAVRQYLDFDSLLTVKNLVVPPIFKIMTPNPMRWFENPTAVTLYRESFPAVFTYIAMPFAALAVMRRPNILCSAVIGIAGIVFLAASYTLLTSFPETYRYAQPMSPLFFALAVVGYLDRGHPWRRQGISVWIIVASLFTLISHV